MLISLALGGGGSGVHGRSGTVLSASELVRAAQAFAPIGQCKVKHRRIRKENSAT